MEGRVGSFAPDPDQQRSLDRSDLIGITPNQRIAERSHQGVAVPSGLAGGGTRNGGTGEADNQLQSEDSLCHGLETPRQPGGHTTLQAKNHRCKAHSGYDLQQFYR